MLCTQEKSNHMSLQISQLTYHRADVPKSWAILIELMGSHKLSAGALQRLQERWGHLAWAPAWELGVYSIWASMPAPAQVRKDAKGSSLGLLTVQNTANFYQQRCPELGARELAQAYPASLTKSLEKSIIPIPSHPLPSCPLKF